MKRTFVHFRNDDVRDSLDESLIRITDLFIKYKIPITHVVEPANVTKDVINWLLSVKKAYPNLIEIGQHGYEHKDKNYERPGEFGGQRTYQEQFEDLKKGKELMDSYFVDLWFPILTFPFGGVNQDTFKAADDLNFKVVNGGYGKGLLRKVLYTSGRLLRKNFIFKKRVSWNLKYKPYSNLFEIDVNAGFIKEYIDEGTNCIFNNLGYMINKTTHFFDQKVIGILLHHRYHTSKASIKLVEDYLKWIKQFDKLKFVTQEEIYNKYAK